MFFLISFFFNAHVDYDHLPFIFMYTNIVVLLKRFCMHIVLNG